jgi:AraC-like DNA-binding protein
MPQTRQLLATGAGLDVEHVTAPPHGPHWGPLYRAPSNRWVLPLGGGDVQRQNDSDLLLVDSLTAFHLAEGEAYRLRHDRPRRHLVLSGRRPGLPAGRAWLLSPGAVMRLRMACTSGRDATAAAAAVAGVLAQSPHFAPASLPDPVRRSRVVLARDAASPLTLARLSDEAGVSAFHLARLFRRHLGVGIHQYQLRLRIAAALANLEAGERSLAGLACDLGFTSQSHFGDVFRRETGLTPARARHLLAA